MERQSTAPLFKTKIQQNWTKKEKGKRKKKMQRGFLQILYIDCLRKIARFFLDHVKKIKTIIFFLLWHKYASEEGK